MSRLYSQKEIEQAFKKFDKDNSKEIDKDEFIICITYICEDFDVNKALEWFDKFDEDKSGFIDVEEFTKVVREIERLSN